MTISDHLQALHRFARLAELEQLALLDSPPEPSFDRLTRLTSTLLGVPVSLISLVTADRQFLKSAVGLPEPWASERQAPLSHSFCQHVVTAQAPLIIRDAREHPLVRENHAIPDIGVIAYAGVPLVSRSGEVLGSLCAIDHTPRDWTEAEIALLGDLAASVNTELALRAERRERLAAQQALAEIQEAMRAQVTALEARARELLLLNELADVLQHCASVDEVYGSTVLVLREIFPGLDGALYAPQEDSDGFVRVGRWGMLTAHAPQLDLRFCQIDAQRSDTAEAHQHPSNGSPVFCIPLRLRGDLQGILHLSSRDVEGAEIGDSAPRADIARTVADYVALALGNLRLRTLLQRQSLRDELTGLRNRRDLETSIPALLMQASERQQPLGVIMLDIDHYKRFNDTYGHAVGDAVLRQLGSWLTTQVRDSDLVYRYGGEEFTILLPGAPLSAVAARAEQICRNVHALTLLNGNQHIGPITLSLGVAVWPQHAVSFEAVLAAADEALYEAKRAGRDRVVRAAPPAAAVPPPQP